MDLLDRIEWLGQSTVKISTGDIIIYVDPYLIDHSVKADYVFITHGHYDHLSLDDLKKVCNRETQIFAPYDCIPKLSEAGYSRIRGVTPGENEDLDQFKFETVPAYNVIKTTYHPKGNKWLGYVFVIEGTRIYHAGDTERIPEMKEINCDIALLPLGQTYTMNNVEDAVSSALDVNAKIAIPIHYGLYEGTEEDAFKFKELLKDRVEVIIK